MGQTLIETRELTKDYYLGGHPVWQLFRSAYQMTRPPHLIGGLCLLAGYVSASLRGVKRPISDELVRFNQAEQMARLKGFFRKRAQGAIS